MSSFVELARGLCEAESPLAGSYEALEAAAATEVERALARHLADSQRFQLAFLALLERPLPERVRCFARIGEDEVKLREGPGAAHRVMRELAKGTPCLVVEFQGFWARVQLPDGVRGWAFREYVQCERRVAPSDGEDDEALPSLAGQAAGREARARRSAVRLR